ncbi:MAG: LPXTG cell wall anchor domain-containing protein [Ruminococcus sp.]
MYLTYQDDKTKEIEITKELTNERIPTGDYVKSPKTGDDTNIWLPILLLVLSVGGIAGIFWYTKRKTTRNKKTGLSRLWRSLFLAKNGK